MAASSSSSVEDMMAFYDAEEDGSDDGGGAESAQRLQPHIVPDHASEDVQELSSNKETAREESSPPRSRLEYNNNDVGARLSRSRKRYSLPALVRVPAVPLIPEHLLATGKRATVTLKRTTASNASKGSRQNCLDPPSPTLPIQRPSTSSGEKRRSASRISISRLSRGHDEAIDSPRSASTRRRSLHAHHHSATLQQLESRSQRSESMDRSRGGRNEDLFLELANDQAVQRAVRPPSRGERASSRLSFAGKRRSLPADRGAPSSADKRPKTSGHIFGNRPPSRFGSTPSELQRHIEQHHTDSPYRAGSVGDDSLSMSGRSNTGRGGRFAAFQERSYMPPSRLANQSKSPELPHYGRRRPSFGTTASGQALRNRSDQPSSRPQDSFSESPEDNTDPKKSIPDSTDVDSDAADTVWDELDDLKSRIKKLELTGKMPSSSGAAMSGDSSERPRTATTAPTTIDSSPKHEKQATKAKPDLEVKAETSAAQPVSEQVVGGSMTANIHPLLHAALKKAKPLLNAPLYRSLEATAADALQVAAMTGSAGPQGTAFSAAAIINGVTVSDRHVRRKADTMCRNLTDLCLALCEGKHEAPSIVNSPVTLSTPNDSSPSLRYARSRLGPNDNARRSSSRPMSRLEARRTSILGSQMGGSIDGSPAGGDDASASEQELTPSMAQKHDTPQHARPASRLQRIRQQRYADSAHEDDDPTIRPPSRAMTDVSRTRPSGPRDFSTPQRSPGLRDSLAARRSNATAHEGNRELTRVASLSSDSGRHRRFRDPSTPPVLEEEAGGEGEEYQPSSASSLHPNRRIMSLNRHAPRRTAGDLSGRTTSLTQRRQLAVE